MNRLSIFQIAEFAGAGVSSGDDKSFIDKPCKISYFNGPGIMRFATYSPSRDRGPSGVSLTQQHVECRGKIRAR